MARPWRRAIRRKPKDDHSRSSNLRSRYSLDVKHSICTQFKPPRSSLGSRMFINLCECRLCSRDESSLHKRWHSTGQNGFTRESGTRPMPRHRTKLESEFWNFRIANKSDEHQGARMSHRSTLPSFWSESLPSVTYLPAGQCIVMQAWRKRCQLHPFWEPWWCATLDGDSESQTLSEDDIDTNYEADSVERLTCALGSFSSLPTDHPPRHPLSLRN